MVYIFQNKTTVSQIKKLFEEGGRGFLPIMASVGRLGMNGV